MAGAGNIKKNHVKVVIINTQYVETDEMSFKSVVQSLTGKDSIVATRDSRFVAGEGPRMQYSSFDIVKCNNNTNITASPVLSRGMSFKDFDRMLMELPPLNELFSGFT